MKDLSQEAYVHQADRMREFLRKLEEFSDNHLTEDERIDRDLAIHILRLRTFEVERLRMHERMAIAAEDLGSALFFLFTRDDDPLEKRIDAIISRLEKVPQYLERSKSSLVSPCRLWNEIALETGKELGKFLDVIEAHALDMLGRTDRTMRLSSNIAITKSALAEYNLWIEREVLSVATSSMHMSAEMFEEYMRLKDFDVTPDEALRIGEVHRRKTRNEMASVARKIVRSGSVEEALELVKSMHPADYDAVLACYRTDIQRSKDFLLEKDLVTIPDGERLIVTETPTFMRHVAPFAAQFEPGKFTGDRTGLFLVTPNEKPETIKDHCYALIANTAVHEGYPGHHLQGICGNTHPSFIRVLSTSIDFAEGWALYCEELMLELGFNNTPEGRLAQLSDLMFRIVRVAADVKLSRGEITPEEVAAMLVRETSMQSDAAMSEARSYSYNPTYYLSYFIGKMRLLQLLDDVKDAMGDRFSIKLFHDTLLYAGCIPISFMRREMAMRLKQEYDIELGEPKERLVDYALRVAQTR
ncbi:MAG TPA: DUF885 domain-containing protein [Thermoplasmata archaeon]|nr:DUF885 domain-containing protein [Thermoplasmata archaeon]